MNKEKYDEYIEALKAQGYNFVCNSHNLMLYCYKVIEYRDDDDGNRRAVCQLIFKCCETKDERIGYEYYLIVPVVVVTRNTDELLNFGISKPKRSIEECERIAKEVMRFVDNNINEYQDNGK